MVGSSCSQRFGSFKCLFVHSCFRCPSQYFSWDDVVQLWIAENCQSNPPRPIVLVFAFPDFVAHPEVKVEYPSSKKREGRVFSDYTVLCIGSKERIVKTAKDLPVE